MRYSSFKPPHYNLQACPENLPNMEEGVDVCKTTNSLPNKSHAAELEDNYNYNAGVTYDDLP